MKKRMIILACMTVCFILFTGCTDKKEADGQNPEQNSTVEADVKEEAGSIDEPTVSDALPDDFTYSPKDAENSNDIVVTPKE